jgi:hypothetical protein
MAIIAEVLMIAAAEVSPIPVQACMRDFCVVDFTAASFLWDVCLKMPSGSEI